MSVATLSMTFVAVGHVAKPKASGISLWAVVVAIGVIVGIPASVIGILSYVDYRRQRRVDREIIEFAKSSVEAKNAQKKRRETEQDLKETERDLEQLKGLRDDLSRQIAELPREANRLFLERQLEVLAGNISKDFSEYQSIEARLSSVETASALDPRIRGAIETSILPVQKERERRNGYILLILILLLLLNLSPIRISDYVWRYFNVLSDSPDWTPDSPQWMIVFGSLVVTGLLWCAYSLIPRFQKIMFNLQRIPFAVASASLLVIAIILGYNFRDDAASSACYPDYCGYPPVPYVLACIAFNLAPLFGGLFLFLIFKLLWPKMFSVFSRSSAAG